MYFWCRLDGTFALRVNKVTVTRNDDSVELDCDYTLRTTDRLKMVKWLKKINESREEFYRYTPNEEPVKQVFPESGIKVNVSELPSSMSFNLHV